MKFAAKTAAVAGIAAAFYGFWVRPRLLRWGATDEEVAGPYPGAELVPEGDAGQRWPSRSRLHPNRSGRGSSRWAVIVGAGTPGTASTTAADQALTEVHPEWQDLDLGDYVKYWTQSGPVDAWKVAALEPNRFLGLRGLTDLRGRKLDPEQPRPSAYIEGLWGFLLNELPGGRTRLVIGGYEAFRPRWVERYVTSWLFVPVVWIMQARMLVVLKRNIERAANAQPRSDTSRELPSRLEEPSATA